MKIAAAQTVVSRNVRANGATIRQMITDAAAEGVQLIVFCEGALSGYAKAQIASPDDWASFDWAAQEAELRDIAALCGQRGITAAVGGAHRLTVTPRPHNSLYVFSPSGALLTRYDKRLLSHSEVSDWYTPGSEPITFAIGGYRFGCAICIESQFPEIFAEYEEMGVDAVLFASYGIPEHFQIAMRAHAGLNCIWIAGATAARKAHECPAGIIGPDGVVSAACPAVAEFGFAVATLDRDNPAYDVPLNKARPWRAKARAGNIYRERSVDDLRSARRGEY
ncbi:carbon-nitrogen hydrolase family protein (plasmid) [Methylocystis rosea]|uniref:Carbon-nitrogen hydrolase family protein n=1 Tax=Methylocystis rosea TaxID=173366 RepID=A0A3G8MAJ5_9HYPH|nr:carbon-nitrogen hydrolase family protein [Methylocystis rosea]